MRSFITVFLLALSGSVVADQYQCSYPGYADGGTIEVKIDIEGGMARVASGDLVWNYVVAEDNEYGAILVHPISRVGLNSPTQHDIGLFTIAIDKTNMKMIRATIVHGGAKKAISSRAGPCQF